MARSDNSAAVARRRRRVTLADVASAAGVAVPTVSGILNQREDCYASKATRERVIDAARTLGYRPNHMARALTGKPTATVGLIVTGFDVESTAMKFAGFEAAARESGRLALTVCSKNEAELENQVIRWLLDRCVDGLAVYVSEHGPHDELKTLVDQGFPVVTFDGQGRLDFSTDDVSSDYYAGGMLQGRHLIDLGCRKVIAANNRHLCYVSRQKRDGLLQAFADAKLPQPLSMNMDFAEHAQDHWQMVEFAQLGEYLAEHRGEFDGIAGAGDMFAIGCIRYLMEQGVDMPGDVAVIGYDGTTLAEMNALPLSTVYHQSRDIGRLAFELLERRIVEDVKPQKHEQIMVPPELVVRQSTKRD